MPPKRVTTKRAAPKRTTNTASPLVENGTTGGSRRLLIVESPGKIAKIQSFLPKTDLVIASVGHIRDLKSSKDHRFGVNLENDFAPQYEISKDRDQVIKKMIQYSHGRQVILAADQDREGEAIAESCRDVLGLSQHQYTRIVFNEITKTAILNALSDPGKINYHLVDAQLCRRTLDILVGFSLSPLVSKLPNLPLVDYNLGTGRVQSVIVRLAIERERQIAEQLEQLRSSGLAGFEGSGLFLMPLGALELVGAEESGLVDGGDTSPSTEVEIHEVECDLVNGKEGLVIPTLPQTESLLREILKATWQLQVPLVKVSSSFSRPSAPFTTSNLGSEAHSKFGFTMKQTMAIAQKLYERGLITYMRTDSPTLSEGALEGCRQYIADNFGEGLHNQKQYTAKTANAQEAHEAIRPTDLATNTIEGTSEEQRLYGLIWRQTIASQMAPAETLVANLEFKPTAIFSGWEESWSFKGSLRFLISPGHLLVSKAGFNDPVYQRDSVIQAFTNLNLETLVEYLGSPNFLERSEFQQGVPSIKNRFNESSMIKELERLEIGRPSTYASLLNRVRQHKYLEVKDVPGVEVVQINLSGTVEGYQNGVPIPSAITVSEQKKKVGNQKNRLVPTELGEVVNSFLSEHFPLIVDFEFTKKMEADLDLVSNGQTTRLNVLKTFWEPFQQLVSSYVTTSGINLQGPTGTKTEHGLDTRFWDPLYVVNYNNIPYTVYQGKTRVGRCLRLEGGEKPIFLDWAKSDPPAETETMTLLQGKLERTTKTQVGEYQVSNGKYGLYVEHNGKKYNLPEETDLASLDTATINTVITEHDAKCLRTIGSYQIRNGPYGPYVLVPNPNKGKSRTKGADKPLFVSVPKEFHESIEALTLEDIEQFISNRPKPTAKPKAKAKAKRTRAVEEVIE